MQPRPSSRLTFFHLVYSTTFTLLSLVTLALLLVPPGDAIAQTLRHSHSRISTVFVIGGVYVLTTLIATAIYSHRMYAFRRLLSDIPTTLRPVATLLPRRVRVAVEIGLSRSAYIAALTRPEIGTAAAANISHTGTAPPGGIWKGVEYAAVVAELPAVLEAALGEGMGLSSGEKKTMRSRLEEAVDVGAVAREEVDVFLIEYEAVRFGAKPIDQVAFAKLMAAAKRLLDSCLFGDVEGGFGFFAGHHEGDEVQSCRVATRDFTF